MLAANSTTLNYGRDFNDALHNLFEVSGNNKLDFGGNTLQICDSYISVGQQSISSMSLIFRINTMIPDGLKITQALPAVLREVSEGGYIVLDDIFFMYGLGDTKEDAIQDYLCSLSEYFFIVEESLSQSDRNLKKFGLISSYISR